MLEIKLTKQLGAFRLDLDLQIESAFTALFGPSGAGKTTTLNLISGLLKPATGEIILNGRKLFSKENGIDLAVQKRQIGYIFQESRLFPHFSVAKNLEFGLQRVPGTDRKFGFDEIVQLTGLSAFLNRMPLDLSGGERQRVALARALLASPDYLLMDEPLAALDLPVRLAFLNFLKKIHTEFDLPILYVSHDLSNVLNFADQVVILRDGKNIAHGPPYSLLDKMTARPLVSREDIPNIFEVTVQKQQPEKGLTEVAAGKMTFMLPHINANAGDKWLLNIPASEIILSLDEPENISASNIFPGRLSALHYLGERVLAEIDAGEKFTVEIVLATVERLNLKTGKKVFLIIKASSFRKLR